MSTAAPADVVVVGLGAVGSAIAHHLARGGARVVGIDRWHPPHDHGSSHGASRITRLAVGEGAAYVPLAQRSHALWRALEAESGATLMRTTGLLLLAAPDADALPFHGRSGFFARTVALAERFNIAHERLDAREVQRRWPAFSPRDESAYHERDAGILFPEPCVRAQLDAAARCGATLRFDERVERIDADGPSAARVVTARGSVVASHVVLAAGAWLPSFVAPAERASFAVQRQVLHWFASGRPSLHDPARMPPFVWMHGEGDDAFYGFPALDPGGGVKLATEQTATTTDPDRVDRAVDPAESAALHATHVRGRLVGVSARVVRTATCLYTSRAEGRFLVDADPQRPHVTLVSACSGHGFKHSAALGEAVADRLLGRAPRVDLAPFARTPPAALR